MGGLIPLDTTLGNNEWLKENAEKIKAIFPNTFTDVRNLNMLGIAFQFKLIGIDWRSQDEFGKVMVFLEKAGFIIRNGLTIKRAL